MGVFCLMTAQLFTHTGVPGTHIRYLCWGHAPAFGIDGGHAPQQQFDGWTKSQIIPKCLLLMGPKNLYGACGAAKKHYIVPFLLFIAVLRNDFSTKKHEKFLKADITKILLFISFLRNNFSKNCYNFEHFASQTRNRWEDRLTNRRPLMGGCPPSPLYVRPCPRQSYLVVKKTTQTFSKKWLNMVVNW